MPRAAAELHAADEILPLDEIAPRILFYFQTSLAKLGSPTG
jgi:chemotaxis response regulator CheB